MAKGASKKEESPRRTSLLVPREEARRRVLQQIEKGNKVPNRSVNEDEAARQWYDFTAELLRQLFSTDELFDEFTGRGHFYGGDDITTARYLRKLRSIYERLDLYPEDVPTAGGHSSTDPVVAVKKLADRFHAVTRQLRQRHDNRPTLDVADEYDVQDLLHALLVIYFDDIRPEEWTPSYAGGSSRMDFLLKTEKAVVEVKKTKAKLGAKEVGDQLAIDIVKYRAHPDCKTLICLIYDPDERITNPRGFEQDLGQPMGEMFVVVYVVQK